MPPPRQVPDGLSSNEYLKLAIQYLLMDWKKQSLVATRKAIGTGDDLPGTPFEGLTPEQHKQFESALSIMERTMDFGEQVAGAAKYVGYEVQDKLEQVSNFADDLLRDHKTLKGIKAGLEDAMKGITKQAGETLGRAMEDLALASLPPRDVPDGLAPEEYLDMGIQYKDMGWTEQARDALLKARECHESGEIGDRAMRYLRTKLPRQPVPHIAVKRNILGHNQMRSGHLDAAKETFDHLIADYPDFEWPYGNLGALYLRLGDTYSAKAVLWKAVDLNPNYLNAWLHLARAKAIDSEFPEARKCVDEAISLDPEDEAAVNLKNLLEYLRAL